VTLERIQHIDTDRVDPHIRRLYVMASILAVVGNIALLVAKGVVAAATGSSAIYADAANSAADVVYSLLMVLALWLALQPPDAGHPHGHRRIEPLVSMAIGGMMAFAAYQAARTGVITWRLGAEPVLSIWALLVPVLTVLIKWGMYAQVHDLGEQAHSPALLAAARDNLADVVSSALALVGVLASRFLTPVADPLAALFVSLWIARSAFEVLQESVRQLIGAAASPELVEEVIDTVSAVPGVADVHRVIIEYVGPQVRADIHINMPGHSSLDEVHQVHDAVQHAVEALEDVDHAFVHVEPVGIE
jgi:cation diffusion facilitator family transporter